MEENNTRQPAEGGKQGTVSDEQAVELYKPALLKALTELQTMMTVDSEDWKGLEILKQEVSRETRGVVLYHKLMELAKIVNEESRGL